MGSLGKGITICMLFSLVFVGATLIVVCSTTLAGSIIITKVRWVGGVRRVVDLLARC